MTAAPHIALGLAGALVVSVAAAGEPSVVRASHAPVLLDEEAEGPEVIPAPPPPPPMPGQSSYPALPDPLIGCGSSEGEPRLKRSERNRFVNRHNRDYLERRRAYYRAHGVPASWEPSRLVDGVTAVVPASLATPFPAVRLTVALDEGGRVVDAIVRCSTDLALHEGAQAAARASRFTPALLGGKPSQSVVDIVYYFD